MFCYFSNNRIPPNGAAIIAKVLPANESLQILKVYSIYFLTTLESYTQSEKTTQTPCGFYSGYETTYFGGQFRDLSIRLPWNQHYIGFYSWVVALYMGHTVLGPRVVAMIKRWLPMSSSPD